MQIQQNKHFKRIIRTVIALMVIAITWYVYEDYVRSTSAQQLGQDPAQNTVVEKDGKSIVKGVVEMVPTPRGILYFPGE